jgi:hypothetical protein
MNKFKTVLEDGVFIGSDLRSLRRCIGKVLTSPRISSRKTPLTRWRSR